MTPPGLEDFAAIWCVDFEFSAPDGERPRVICLVAVEQRSGRAVRLWEDELARMDEPPYGTGPGTLVVAYYASAEMGCHLALGWPMPQHLLDLYTEFRCWTNGRSLPCGSGLLGAAAYFGLDTIAAAEKDSMRDLAIRGGPWNAEEREALLEYCASDVELLGRLLAACEDRVDVPRALLRGRYMQACARIEHNGIPIDGALHREIVGRWDWIKEGLIQEIDADYGVYEGTSFREGQFADWLVAQGIPWPRLETGRLAMDDETFRQMARAYPAVAPLRELRCSLSEMRLSSLAVGSDSRNRCLMSAFRSKTGRNIPSNSKFAFGPAVWMRGLIEPRPGWGIAYIDWSQQEFGIAGALSGDAAMLAAYESGDPYLAFAKQAGAVPADATKESHGAVREQFKQCVLGVQYAMGEKTLAARIGQAPCAARQLLDMHRRTYATFWRWSDACIDFAMLRGYLHTVFGWVVYISETVTLRTLRNFPMQANGAEMLRLACIAATEDGVAVCAPVHDALLIEAPLPELQAAVARTQAAMAWASRQVLGGFELRSDVKCFCYPDRFMDERGVRMWETVMTALGRSRRACEAVA